MELDRLVPPNIRHHLLWLAKIPGWLVMRAATPAEAEALRAAGHPPSTNLSVEWSRLAAHPEFAAHRVFVEAVFRMRHNTLVAAYMETASRLLADGPKLFAPTAEQFEAMEHVEARLPPGDFRSPYPALLIRIPQECRRRLCEEAGQRHDWLHHQVLVGFRRVEGQPLGVLVTLALSDGMEQHFAFTDQPGNPTIETALQRLIVDGRVVDAPSDHETVALTAAARACLNLCLMLTHYGHRVAGPTDPAAYARHRRKAHLAHLAAADCLAVEMVQDVVVRGTARPRAGAPAAPTGAEVRPHWRRGHWRAYPNRAEERARGETVPLVFVKPYLVHPDRVVGDLSQSSATYHGR